MKSWFVAGLAALTVMLYAFQGVPKCTSLNPDMAKAGATVSAKGGKSLKEQYRGSLFDVREE